MIIIDTNVISELMRKNPYENVINWISAQTSTQLSITTISIAEIQRGIARLPLGKRRRDLSMSFSNFIIESFNGSILSFNEEAAYNFGQIASQCEREGLNTDVVDLMIAAIVKAQNASIATRNTIDFQGCGINIINPWE